MNIQKKRRKKRRCIWCGAKFVPNPRLKERQKSCGSADCKRRQNLSAQRHWKKKEREIYRLNQTDWRDGHPGYWKVWRANHPGYVVRNRKQSRVRKAMAKLGLQKKLDILQLGEKQVKIWNIPRFAKHTRSLIPLLFAYSARHERTQSHQEPRAP